MTGSSAVTSTAEVGSPVDSSLTTQWAVSRRYLRGIVAPLPVALAGLPFTRLTARPFLCCLRNVFVLLGDDRRRAALVQVKSFLELVMRLWQRHKRRVCRNGNHAP